MDGPIEDVKYLLEFTDKGIYEHELFSRLLALKNEGKVLGFKPRAVDYMYT